MLPSTWKNGTSLRFGLVILSTVAPYSARIRAIVGPAIMRHISKTLIPDKGRLSLAAGSGQGGVDSSRGITDQGALLDIT